jgi:hypothetical protein
LAPVMKTLPGAEDELFITILRRAQQFKPPSLDWRAAMVMTPC